jgi:hypothetical protein
VFDQASIPTETTRRSGAPVDKGSLGASARWCSTLGARRDVGLIWFDHFPRFRGIAVIAAFDIIR